MRRSGERTTRHASALAMIVLLATALACGGEKETVTPADTTEPSATPTQISVFDSGRAAYGFFLSPPEPTEESFLANIEAIGRHGDVFLTMPQVPWADFIDSADGESSAIDDMRGTIELARQSGLEPILVIDPLQAFNRTLMATLPPELEGGDFGTEGVRQTFTNYAVRLVREFDLRYLGLGSEVNTYADAHPDDFEDYVSLYRETYAAIKAESSDTLIFVTFQWEDLNSVGLFAADDPGRIKWEIIEALEPWLDVWAISTYPYFAFDSAAEIPDDYYASLLARTDKPLAIGEGGYIAEDVREFHGSDEDQIGYLNTLHSQIGERLVFWTYLVIDDVNTEAYAQLLTDSGSPADAELVALFGTLGLRTIEGVPKPALAVWDSFRTEE
ncbi:MAG: hypothetical protein E3J64_04705 [Anaerolineales bacterium]|nr:MAG: hypothetical protein E3J64_04705 [Anaerolineales bacterium]